MKHLASVPSLATRGGFAGKIGDCHFECGSRMSGPDGGVGTAFSGAIGDEG